MVGAPVKPTGPSPQPPQKPRPPEPRREGGSGRRNGRPGPVIRILVSLWLVWHFTAVFLAALQVPGTSDLVNKIAQSPKSPMRLYLNAFYLNQAHSFFAPEVGPGHVVRYELYDTSNRNIKGGSLPNKNDNNQSPRLFYHRHMMLADQSEGPTQRQFLEAYARHLLRVNTDAHSVRVTRFAQWPLPRALATGDRRNGYRTLAQDLARNGQQHTIRDDGFELIQPEVVLRRSDLPPELPAGASSWHSDRPNVARGWSGGPPR
jgi:hypothetical protein